MAEQGGEPNPTLDHFKVCSTCRKPIAFGARYYQCSVSTCNRSRTALFFCSVPCWDAHVPEARHRDAWAEEVTAPTREAYEGAQREALEAEKAKMQDKPERKIVTLKNDDVPKEILVVVSKLKAYIRARSGMNTSDAVAEVLSDHLRQICDLAIDRASADGRKTVLDRDVKPIKIVGS